MDVREVRTAMIGKLEAFEDRSGGHVFFYLPYEGREYKGPKLSHSWRGELNDQQIDWLKKPLLLTKAEFENLVDCSLETEQFYEVCAQRKSLA